MTNFNRRPASIANGQLGIVTRAQALASDGSNRQLRSRVASGTLDQIGPRTYRLPGADFGPLAELQALLLDIGGDVRASGPTAARSEMFLH